MKIALPLTNLTHLKQEIKVQFPALMNMLLLKIPTLTCFILLFCLFSLKSFAQPVNDDPCNAIALTSNSTCTYQTFTNQNATATFGLPAPGCALYSGGDVWFTVQVPCNGTITIDTQTGIMTDGGMAIYSGDCANLTLIECDDDDSPNGLMPSINASGLIPNSTVWIRIWEAGNDNNGTFGICISLPSAPGPGGTCNAAIPFCSSNIYSFPNSTSLPGGLGGNGIYGCLQSTPNPVWYYMQVQNTGPLTLNITQTTLLGLPLDVDFVMWGPFTNLSSSCGNLSAGNIIDCSYSISNVETANIPNAISGEFYVILITNFDNQPGTITFQQTGGTATTNCIVICNITAGNSGPVCTNSPFNLTATTVPNATYSWTGPNCFSSTQQNPTGIIAPSVPGTYTYSVTATTPTGSECTTTTTVTVGSLGATVSTVNPSCANLNNGSLTITPTSGSGPYLFTLNPGAISNSTGIFTNLSPAINYTYVFTDAVSCSGNGSFILTGNNPIITPAIVSAPLCFGSVNGSVRFNPSGGVSPYQYSINGGTNYQPGNVFNGLPAGTYTFRIRDNIGCIQDTSITIIQPSLLTLAVSNTSPAGCSNNDGILTAIANAGTSPYIYTISGPTVNTSGSNSGIFSGLDSGIYIVTVTDTKACSASINIPVTLIDNMFLTLGTDVEVCAESSVTLNPQTNPETSLFAWRSSNAAASTIADPLIKNVVVTPPDTAQYILLATWGVCQREDSIIVNVLKKPIADAGKDTLICNISYAVLRGSSSNVSGPVNYLWSPNAGMLSPGQSSTRVYPAGSNTTYTYTLTVQDNYGCNFSVSDKVDVRVKPPVPANAGNDTNAVKNIPHQLYGRGGRGYLWSPSFSLNNATLQNPLATLQNNTQFILRVTDVAGCIGYDTVLIKVYDGPTYYVPNAFSPNSDGLNDIFRPIPVGIEKTEWFRIFNRYGELLFETNKWLKGWDGTYKSKKQNPDTYVWIIKGVDRNGKTVEMKGSVTLVR